MAVMVSAMSAAGISDPVVSVDAGFMTAGFIADSITAGSPVFCMPVPVQSRCGAGSPVADPFCPGSNRRDTCKEDG